MMDDANIKKLLERARTIAVVGLSPNPVRPSNDVSRSLQRFGYRIIPVNPHCDEVLGETCFAQLADIPQPIDIVDVFRAPEHVPAIVGDCITLAVPVLWLQEGVVHESAARRARSAGIEVVTDRCIYKQYMRLCT